MRKILSGTFVLLLNLFMTGCAPVFSSQACHHAATAPTIDNQTLIKFAALHIKLLPRGNALVVVLPVDYFFKQTASPALIPDKYPNLDQLVSLLKEYGPAKIKVAGYSDNVGNRIHNQLSSEQQARAVVTYLWVKGIPADQLYAVGYGDSSSVADNATPEGSTANRRVEITVKASCV